ncbi:related to aflatoxin efflux pump AFLT [Cephalotrichum gorgonifer]|uniref:Related to aflatoxin efflux pump AFLT n=1 Tax=Cephalotrichum gorgonifer TaxID=2041049 RepID=A0AAE8N4H9_9PEZI|nr:related to aflatoxin efflux pump AFLT [Cephalotrichum gorgonifer]
MDSSRASTLAGDDAVEAPDLHAVPSRLSRVQSRQDPEKDGGEKPLAAPDTASAPAEQVRTITGYRWVLVLTALYSSAFLYGLDTTIAADIQGAVVETFGKVNQLAWLGAGFPMGSVAIILLVGSLYASFNFKWLFITFVLLFEIGSAVCGAAPNMNALIVGRAIAGAGGSGIYLGCLNYISAMTAPAERGTYISGIGLLWGLGCVLGPLIGGGLAESAATWRWAFYINLPIGGLVSPMMIIYLPNMSYSKGASVWGRVRNLDFLGFLLNIGIWVMFALSFTMAGAQWAWSDGRAIASVVVFGALVIIYALQQYFVVFTTPETRSFPVHLLRSRTQLLLYVATSANITAMFVVTYFIPIYFQFVHNDNAIMAAVRLLPFVAVAVTTNLAAGWLLSKVKFYMPIFLVSGVFILLGGSLLLGFLTPDTPQGQIYGFSVLMAFGVGLTLQLAYAVGPMTAPAKYMGDVISFLNVSQIGGTVISLVVAGQVFQSLAAKNLRAALAGQGFTDAEIVAGVAGARSELFTKLSGELRAQAVEAITKAIQKAFVLPVVGGAVLIVASVLMKRERLFGKVVVAG